MKKRFLSIFVVLCMILTMLAGCGSSTDGQGDGKASADGDFSGKKIRLAYQYGTSYFPLLVMKEKGLIEKHAPGVEVEWTQLNSGAAICEAMISGSLDVGAVGVGPLVINVLKGGNFKMYSALSSFPMEMLSMDSTPINLSDIKPDEQIALVNIGSIQHICLAMLAEKELGDAHALDTNIIAMAHPDGLQSLLSGSVKYQLTAMPYIQKGVEQGATVVNDMSEVWPTGTTFIVGMATTQLHDNEPELYQALVDATAEAIEYLNNNKADVAALLCENEGVDAATLQSWLELPSSIYSTEANKVLEIAQFMYRADFVKKEPTALSDLAYDNVKGN